MEAGVSKLYKVEFARNPCPALLKEPRNFWDDIFIANEAYMLDEVTHPRVRRKLAYDAAAHRLFLEYIDDAFYERNLRAHYCKIYALILGKFQELIDIVGFYIDEFGYPADAAVARRAIYLRTSLALSYLPAERMFPSS